MELQVLKVSLKRSRVFFFSLTFILALSQYCWAWPDAGDEVILQTFLADMVTVLKEPKSEQPDQIRMAIAKNPKPIIWAIEGRDLFLLLENGGLPISKPKNIALLETFVGGVQKVQGQPAFQKAMTAISQVATKASFEKKLFLLNQINDPPFEAIAKATEVQLEQLDVSKLEALNALNSKEGFNFNATEDESIKTFKALFAAYFNKLSVQQKVPIVAGLLRLPPNASSVDRISVVLQNSGIVMQKLIQAIAQRIESAELREAARKLLESIQPFSSEEARRLIEQDLKKPINEIFSEFNDIPLKAATTGQVHLAKLKDSGETVVVKVLRPNVQQRAISELAMIKSIAIGTSLENQIDELASSLLHELDYRNEAQALLKGKIYNDKKRNLSVVEMIDGFSGTENVLVLKLAAGKSLSSFKSDQQIIKGEILKKSLGRWLEVALFENGFFNGDLHAGNIFADTTNSKNPKITFIDFGNVHELTIEQRRGFVGLALGVLRSSPSLIAKAFGDITQLKPSEVAILEESLAKIDFNGQSIQSSLNEVLATAIGLKYRVPSSILMLNRGLLFFVEEIRLVNLELDKIDPANKIDRIDVNKIYMSTIVRKTLKDVAENLMGKNNEREKTVTSKMFRSIIAASSKRILDSFVKSCKNIFASPAVNNLKP